jgi:glyoxylase-like metal-dependent hydrolase (beta-lactamase superfamily II)/8-oxo-dGTP pyrophosphatase MutT (NUDIX family)
MATDPLPASAPAPAPTAAKPPARPVALAAAVVLHRRTPGLEAYWVQRRDELAYLGGFHAFPGGRVAREDRAVRVAGVDEPERAALLACAVRETFEETGVLLARGARRVSAARRDEARRAMLAEDLSLEAFLAGEELAIDVRDFVPAGRWVSPPFTPGGFDTQFFLCELPEGEVAHFDPGELQGGEWLSPGTALERWREHKALLAAPALYTLRELLARPDAGPKAGGEALGTTPEARGGDVPRIEVHPGFVLVPQRTETLAPATHTNCIVIGGPELLVVDPGSKDPVELQALDRALDRLLAEGRRVHGTLVTHHHGDHWGGVEHVRQRYGGPVYAHAWTAPRVGADRALEGGETITLEASPGGQAWRLEVLFTPGHTPGHLALYEPVSGTIVAGDLVSGLSTVIIDPPEGDMAAYLASLSRLLERPATLLLPGHGPPIGGPRHRLRFYLEHRAWREGRIVAALGEGTRALEEIVTVAYDDTPVDRHGIAARSALAHLLKLEGEGRVEQAADGRWLAAGKEPR